MGEFADGVLAERNRFLDVWTREGADAKALHIAFSCMGLPTALPIEARDNGFVGGVMEERARIARVVTAYFVTKDTATAINNIRTGAPCT